MKAGLNQDIQSRHEESYQTDGNISKIAVEKPFPGLTLIIMLKEWAREHCTLVSHFFFFFFCARFFKQVQLNA